MDCRQWKVKPAYQMETSLGFGLGLQPHHSKCLLVKISTSYAHLLLEAIASQQLWTTSVHPPLTPLRGCSSNCQTSEDRPQLFLNLPLVTCDEHHVYRFPRLALQYLLFASHSPRPPFTPFIKSIILCLLLILCSWQTALCSRTGFLHGALNFRLPSPFSAPAPPGRGSSRNLSSTSPPAGPMRAPDSRPSISVSPAARSAAYRTGAVMSPVSSEARLSSCSPSGCHRSCWKAIWDLGPPVSPGKRRALSNPGHLLAVLDNMTPVSNLLFYCIVSPCRRISWAKRPRSRPHLGPLSRSRHSLITVHFNGLHPQHYQRTSRRLPRPSCS